MRTAIYGAGSLGTVLGAYLTRAGIECDLISRNKAHITALQQKGAHIVGKVDLTVGLSALLPEQMQGTYDLIFLLTKQLENRKVATFLRSYLAKDGLLVTMQNGLPESELAQVLGAQRVAGCAIGWGATLQASGVAELTSEPEALAFSLGMLTPGREERLQAVASLLGVMGPVTIEENFIGARWSKLLINASFSGTATVLGCTFGEVAKDKKARRIAQLILKECFDTGHSLGITFEPVQGKNLEKLFDYQGRVKQKLSYLLIPLAMKKHASLKPSMLQDIEKGKKCEVDSINGILSKEGKRAGIATPVNDLVVQIISRLESGQLKPCRENLGFFKAFLS